MATFREYLQRLLERLRPNPRPDPGPDPGPVDPPKPPEVSVAFFLQDIEGNGIPDAKVQIRGDWEDVGVTTTSAPDGRVVYTTTHLGNQVHVTITKEGYFAKLEPRIVPLDQLGPTPSWPNVTVLRPNLPPLPPPIPLAQLARVRGAMWTRRWNGPRGPRPGQPSNILAMDYYEQYGPDDRKRMIEIYKAPGYTHAVTGPFIDPGGYHGRWDPVTTIDQRKWDHYLDAMQEWYDADIRPVHFMSPDNWSLERCMDELTEYYLQPRAQALLPIKVPHGWEPARYGTSSRTWALWGQWAAEVSSPETLILAHTVCDVDALVGGDARYNDDGHPNGDGWKYVAPSYHGWLIQLCGFVDPYMERDPDKQEERARLLAAWPGNLAAYFRDLDRRFRHGYAGWPTGSKFGPNVPMKLYAAEYASYAFFNDGGITEAQAQSFGDIAMANGASGYLDGGSVNVP